MLGSGKHGEEEEHALNRHFAWREDLLHSPVSQDNVSSCKHVLSGVSFLQQELTPPDV